MLELVVTFDARKRHRAQQCLGAVNFVNARYLVASVKMGWRIYLCQGKDSREWDRHFHSTRYILYG